MAKRAVTKRKLRNRAAQDATLLNVRALKRRVDKLEKLVQHLLKHVFYC